MYCIISHTVENIIEKRSFLIIHYSPATEVAASEDHNHGQCWCWAEKVLVLMLTEVTSGGPGLQWRALQTISRGGVQAGAGRGRGRGGHSNQQCAEVESKDGAGSCRGVSHEQGHT